MAQTSEAKVLPIREEEDVLETPSGVTARAQGEVIELRDPRGEMILSFDGATGALRIASVGDLVFGAAGKVVIEGGTDLELRAPNVETTAGRVSVHAKEHSTNADKVDVVASEMTTTAGRLEVRAQRLFERTVEAYREVEGLMQSRAGRLRTIVKGAARLFAQRHEVISQEDSVIDGKRVLLG